MLQFPQPPPPKRPPETSQSLGLYLQPEAGGAEEWKRGVRLILWGVPPPPQAVSAPHPPEEAWPLLLEAHKLARRGWVRDLETLAISPPVCPTPAEQLAAEIWLDDFSPPRGSQLEKFVRRLRDVEAAPGAFPCLLAAQGATFHLPHFQLLLAHTYWCWRSRIENDSEFIDNAKDSLTLLLQHSPHLPAAISEFLSLHDPSPLHPL